MKNLWWLPVLSVGLACWGCRDTSVVSGGASLRSDTAQVSIRIGSYDGSHDALSAVWALAVSPDGERIYALENQSRQVRIFNREGGFEATAGGSGGGPGEFGNPVALGFVGDTLWVADVFSYRYSLFDQQGRFLTDFRPLVMARQGPDDHPPRPSTLLEDGTLLGSTQAFSREIAEGVVTRMPVLRMRRDGSVIDTVAWRSVENTGLMIQSPDPKNRPWEIHTRQPFSESWPMVVSGMDSTVTRLFLDDTTRMAELACSGFDGSTVFRTPVGWDSARLDQHVIDSTIAALVNRLATGTIPGGAPVSDIEEGVRKALYVPEYLPPVAEMLRSSSGDFWLRRAVPQGGVHDQWRVVSTKGEILRDVFVPSGVRLRAIHETDLWGTLTDEMDVTFIVRLNVRD